MTIGTLMSRDLCYHGYETASHRISGFVNKCYKARYEVHTDMANGDSVAIYAWSSTCLRLRGMRLILNIIFGGVISVFG